MFVIPDHTKTPGISLQTLVLYTSAAQGQGDEQLHASIPRQIYTQQVMG